MEKRSPLSSARRLAAGGALLGLLAWPAAADAQLFFGSRPHPGFAIGPLFVRARVTPAVDDVTVDVLFSVAVPPNRSASDIEQDLYFLWPGAVGGGRVAGAPDPRLAAAVRGVGLTPLEEGRLELFARNLYGAGGRAAPEAIPGGAPFVTFVREGGALGLSAPATYVRIPWTPRLVNRAWLVDLRFTARDIVKPKPATWFERTFWGPRHRIALGFNDVRSRAVFPLYFVHRDRVVRLSEDPSQLLINFSEAGRLKIDELFPQSSGRRLSETQENTEVVSLFLDRSEGITPQVMTVQFGYFSGLQAWAPVLIPVLFFVLGNAAGVVVRSLAAKLGQRFSSRVHVGRSDGNASRLQSGVLLPRETLARIVPGETTYDDVLRLCGRDPEEHERLASPDRRTLVYRGRRVVPRPRRRLGWLSTVDGWDVEHHEVSIELDGDVVRDVQANVRRTHPSSPTGPTAS